MFRFLFFLGLVFLVPTLFKMYLNTYLLTGWYWYAGNHTQGPEAWQPAARPGRGPQDCRFWRLRED